MIILLNIWIGTMLAISCGYSYMRLQQTKFSGFTFTTLAALGLSVVAFSIVFTNGLVPFTFLSAFLCAIIFITGFFSGIGIAL